MRNEHNYTVLPPNPCGAAARVVLLAFVRNECPTWAEWLGHHRAQGVAHFYAIDHNSTDACDLASFGVGGDLTVWPWSRPLSGNYSTQEEAYRYYMPRLRAAENRNDTWLAILDVDEFVFGMRNLTFAQHLNRLPGSLLQLCMNWLTFGSSGHFKQPRCITQSNLYRKPLPFGLIGKCVQRLNFVSRPTIHRAFLVGEQPSMRRAHQCACASTLGAVNKVHFCKHSGVGYMSEACEGATPEKYRQTAVRLHHYPLQSQQTMLRKQARGGGTTPGRKKTQLFFAREEWANNLQRDASLADLSADHRAPCTPDPGEPPARALTPDRTAYPPRFTWNTWAAMPWTVKRELVDVDGLPKDMGRLARTGEESYTKHEGDRMLAGCGAVNASANLTAAVDQGRRLRGSRRGGGAKANATPTPVKKNKHTICVFDWRVAGRFSTGALIPDPLSEIQPDHNLIAKLAESRKSRIPAPDLSEMVEPL